MITVFIGTYNRLDTLERTVKSYSRFKTDHELVIVDNGTDDPLCIDMLHKLEPSVKKIYSLPKKHDMDGATANFLIAMEDQKATGGEWFAVTEADVSFERSHPSSLAMYIALAKHTGHAVGPHLRVDSKIPIGYPLRSRVMVCESRLLYREDQRRFSKMFYSPWQTDTTFHLFPKERVFRRLHMDPLRVSYPYDAMHTDWYLDIFNPSVENQIYVKNPKDIQMGSWGRAWIADFWWKFQDNQEEAFNALFKGARPDRGDLCNNRFMISWCYQFGFGCEVDIESSVNFLELAIPKPHPYYWQNQGYWMDMVYNNIFPVGFGE